MGEPTPLAGTVAWVTGSTRGIGRAVAVELARDGADVAVHGRTSRMEGEAVRDAVAGLGRRSTLVLGDTRDPAEVDRMAGEIEGRLGPVGILVNNAASALCKPFLAYTADEWRDQLLYKGLAYYLTARRVLPGMLRRGEGVIVNVLSTVGLRDGAGEAAYAATNGAAVALTRALAAEFGDRGIRTCGVALTWADNAFDPEDPAHRAWLPRFPMGRVTKVEEVARAVAFLASPAASGITGAIVPVDAGFLCR
ncbi:SDR family oxidoreductase [Candidatus Bipolaricaulota bacterium]|nr:SDR family oxidoreductase [Candidatus Bipolaricaulota bacterium]